MWPAYGAGCEGYFGLGLQPLRPWQLPRARNFFEADRGISQEAQYRTGYSKVSSLNLPSDDPLATSEFEAEFQPSKCGGSIFTSSFRLDGNAIQGGNGGRLPMFCSVWPRVWIWQARALE